MSCSRIQHSAFGKAGTRNPSISSQALFHWATVFLLGQHNSDCVNSFSQSGILFGQLITFANSLDPVQAWQNIGPDLDPSCLTPWWYSWMNFSKSPFSKKNQQPRKNHEKLPRTQRVQKRMPQWEEISFFLLFHCLIEAFFVAQSSKVRLCQTQTQLSLYSQLAPFVICW